MDEKAGGEAIELLFTCQKPEPKHRAPCRVQVGGEQDCRMRKGARSAKTRMCSLFRFETRSREPQTAIVAMRAGTTNTDAHASRFSDLATLARERNRRTKRTRSWSEFALQCLAGPGLAEGAAEGHLLLGLQGNGDALYCRAWQPMAGRTSRALWYYLSRTEFGRRGYHQNYSGDVCLRRRATRRDMYISGIHGTED